jgi:excisionase family DNA binding protein
MVLRTREAAGVVGVSKNTLLRWFREGRVGDVGRDRNGWRIFRREDIERIKRYADRTFPPGTPVAHGAGGGIGE